MFRAYRAIPRQIAAEIIAFWVEPGEYQPEPLASFSDETAGRHHHAVVVEQELAVSGQPGIDAGGGETWAARFHDEQGEFGESGLLIRAAARDGEDRR